MKGDLWFDLATAVLAAAAVSIAAWRFGALRASGAVAGTLVGAVVFGFAGLGAALVLVLFLVTSSALSALPPGVERSARGARQVLANGSVAAAMAAVAGYAQYGAVAFLGATAAATADTWATEIGIRWGKRPRSILTLRQQPPGTSGAVSMAGSVAAVCGALAVGTAGSILVAGVDVRTVAAVTVAGFAGSILDSMLGAAFQAEYRCPQCGASPEVARHDGCGVRAEKVSGVPGLDNDAVNWVATLAGAAAAVMLTSLLQ